MSRKQKKTLIRIILSAVLLIVAFCLPVKGVYRAFLFLLPYIIIGYDVLWDALRNILHGQMFDEKFLMMIASIGAFAIGEFAEASAVMLFYQVGEFFQSIAVGKSRKSITSLMDIRPDHVTVLRGGREEIVDPEEVEIGETIIIRPGEKIPLDGEILSGSTAVDTAALTGESIPVERCVKDKVISGSINLSGVITVRTQSRYEESTVAKILELVENSSEKKSKTENFITRFARYYTPCVVIAAVFLAVVPPLILKDGWNEWIHSALSFLVVSCPCALVVSVPLSFFGGIGGASREGILIKGANYLEALSKIDTVVFDKTGTLTKGTFSVSSIHSEDTETVSESKLLEIAALAESFSNHPVGKAVVSAYGGEIDKSRVSEVKELAGMGLEAVVDGDVYNFGNEALLHKIGADIKLYELSGTVIYAARGKKYIGYVVINDEMKDDAKEAVNALKSVGIKKTVMLTGDSEDTAKNIAEEAGVDEWYAKLLPADKVKKVEDLLATGSKVAFVGDGINDAPVLSRSDVGIAMGALGSDAAIESADIVLMDDKPSKIAIAVKISRKTMNIVRQNIIFSLFVKFAILILAALRIANMWVAVFGDVGVMIIAILNSMRSMMKTK